MWICGLIQLGSNLVFVLQAWVGHDLTMLAVTISVENLAGGMGTAAFVAYLSSLCNLSYTATQYALLSSFMAQARTTLSAGGGFLAESMSWVQFLPADDGGRDPGPAAAAVVAAPPPWYAARSDRRSCRPVLERSTHDRQPVAGHARCARCAAGSCRFCWGRRPLLGATTPTRAAPYELAIATGGVTGIYYQFGAAICRLLRDHPPGRPIDCVTEGSGGSVANLQNLREGRVPLALAQSDSTFDAATGAGGFARQGADPKLRALFSPVTEAFMVLTRIRDWVTELGAICGGCA